MNIKDWAAREVELACVRERDASKEDDFDYGCGCYDSALKAFNSLLEDGHSGMSIIITRGILNRLVDGKPLTPIEDTEDVWNNINTDKDGIVLYRCKRMSSLSKYVYPDGTVKYKDTDQFVIIDVNSKQTYSSGLVRKHVTNLFPITMPYFPGKAIRIDCEDFLFDKSGGDFDTKGIFRAVKADGTQIKINKFFKEVNNNWVEIGVQEYVDRRDNQVKKGEQI